MSIGVLSHSAHLRRRIDRRHRGALGYMVGAAMLTPDMWIRRSGIDQDRAGIILIWWRC